MAIIKQTLADATAGSRFKGALPLGTMASGAPISIPFVGIKGAESGPCLWVNGQVHGIEMNGVVAALDFINSLDAARLRGSVVVTATANPLAMDARRKTAPQDDNDLDQTFPGRSDGFIAERFASVMFEETAALADTLINMHTNAATFFGKPYSVYKNHPDSNVQESLLLRYQAAFNPSVACLMDIKPGKGELLGNISGALDYQLLARGIPAFMIELGGGGRAEAPYIAQGVQGMRGVAAQMGILPENDGSKIMASQLRRTTRRRHLTFDHGGLYRTSYHPGDLVKAGSVMGEVMNLHGEVVDRIALDKDVILICTRADPVVHTGDRFHFVAEEWTTVDVK